LSAQTFPRGSRFASKPGHLLYRTHEPCVVQRLTLTQCQADIFSVHADDPGSGIGLLAGFFTGRQGRIGRTPWVTPPRSIISA
jgi:hypothetical protein